MNIAIIGAGYVGLSNALVLSRKHHISIVDVDEIKVKNINEGNFPLADRNIKDYTINSTGLFATCNLSKACKNANYVFVCVPTNLNQEKNSLDIQIVNDMIGKIVKINKEATIVIKSTVPIGYSIQIKEKAGISNLIFSPEFLREGTAIYDTLNPSRVIIGVDKSSEIGLKTAEKFIELWKDIIHIENMDNFIITNYSEAEAIKLFSNSYLAIRIAFFNELDSFSMENELCTKEIIEGICLDNRIGKYYNNPSFGYGGSCLPKDTTQLSIQYSMFDNSIIKATLQSNAQRKKYITNKIINEIKNKDGSKIVGFYRATAKLNSDNTRSSAVLDIIKMLRKNGIKCIVYEPLLRDCHEYKDILVNDIEKLKNDSQIIVANRNSEELKNVHYKLFTRDLFSRD